MSANNEGSGEIEANDRRVATAKKAVALTARNAEAARKALEVAQKEHHDAQEELKEAEKSQKAAHKKWEVVNLADDNDNAIISFSRDPKNRWKEESEWKMLVESIPMIDGGHFNYEKARREGFPMREFDSESGESEKDNEEADYPEQLIVEGCGDEINGTYKRHGAALSRWIKTGKWNGENVTFTISKEPSRRTSGYTWYIGTSRTSHYHRFYYVNVTVDDYCTVPPSHGWQVINGSKPLVEVIVESADNDESVRSEETLYRGREVIDLVDESCGRTKRAATSAAKDTTTKSRRVSNKEMKRIRR